MIDPLESVSRSMDIFHNLSVLTMAGTEELIKRQLEHAGALVSSSRQQMEDTYGEVGAAHTPQEWTEAVQKSLNSTIGTARDCMLSTSKLYAENLRLMQEQAAEVQKVITNGLNGGASLSGASSREKKARTK